MGFLISLYLEVLPSGIVVELNFDNADVLFFNPQNVGDYAIVNVKNVDLELEKEKLPVKFEKELLSKLDDIIAKAKNEGR